MTWIVLKVLLNPNQPSQIMPSVPSLCLSHLFTWNSSLTLISHIHVIILISAHWSDTTFLSLHARFHVHVT